MCIGPTVYNSQTISAQNVALKSNLLYDATSSMNLGVEVGLAPRWTMDVSGSLNPWTFSDNRKMRHLLIQPEARYWFCGKFSGTFFALESHYARYNWGGMLPWGFHTGKAFGVDDSPIYDYRYQGWLAGGGAGIGYAWIWSNHWSMEFQLDLGYSYLKHDKYPCTSCGTKLKDEHVNYLGPTKAAVSLVYLIK